MGNEAAKKFYCDYTIDIPQEKETLQCCSKCCPRCCHNITFIAVGLLYFVIFVVVIQISWSGIHLSKADAHGVTTTKVYGGVAASNDTTHSDPAKGDWQGVWDDADYVQPPKMNNAFFVWTNVYSMKKQKQGTCPESSAVSAANCTTDSDCPEGTSVAYGNGVRTGRCVPAAGQVNRTVCEISAWCPVITVNASAREQATLEDTQHSRVYIQSHVSFATFDLEWSNVLDTEDEEYLTTCQYNHSDIDTHMCPNFIVGDMVQLAGYNYSDIARKGAVIEIEIKWDCYALGIEEHPSNLNIDKKDCVPKYSFSLLGGRYRKARLGHFYRYARNYQNDGQGVPTRDLYHVYGILFTINVVGEAHCLNLGKLLLIFFAFPLTAYVGMWNGFARLFFSRKEGCCIRNDVNNPQHNEGRPLLT